MSELKEAYSLLLPLAKRMPMEREGDLGWRPARTT